MRYHSTKLEDIPHLAHGFFGRQGGVSTGLYASLNCGAGSQDDPASVAENRRLVMQSLGAPDMPLCSLNQIHSAEVVCVNTPWEQSEKPSADAMVTSQPRLALGILTADCGPVLFADPKARVIGAAHAGWKGAVGGVLEHTMIAMEKLGAQREDMIAILGPCIAQTQYQVGVEFYHHLCGIQPENATFFIPDPASATHYRFDLAAYILHRLRASGLQQAQSLAMDTYSQEQAFFSYRRSTHRAEPDYGRQISVIMLDDAA